jgi:hypothetical protein
LTGERVESEWCYLKGVVELMHTDPLPEVALLAPDAPVLGARLPSTGLEACRPTIYQNNRHRMADSFSTGGKGTIRTAVLFFSYYDHDVPYT